MEAIIAEHEKIFEEVCHHANQLAAGNHMRSSDILMAKIEKVQQQWSELKLEAEIRQKALKQAQLAQEVCMNTFCFYCVSDILSSVCISVKFLYTVLSFHVMY